MSSQELDSLDQISFLSFLSAFKLVCDAFCTKLDGSLTGTLFIKCSVPDAPNARIAIQFELCRSKKSGTVASNG